MKVNIDGVLHRWLGGVGSSGGAVSTTRVVGGGQAGSTSGASGEGDGGENAQAGEGRWSPGVNFLSSLPRGATPGFQGAHRETCVNAGVLPLR